MSAESLAVFDELQAQGTIPTGVRMQVQYPTPLASVAGTIVPEDLPAVAPAWTAIRSWGEAVERGVFESLSGLRTGADTELNFALVPYARARRPAGSRP